MDLTLVVACYNEEPHLAANARDIFATLAFTGWDWEVIFIDDCSADRTPELIRELCRDEPRARAIFHEQNVGRGGTVAEGIRAGQGTVAGYIDVDLEVHCRYVPSLVHSILSGECDVATALRVYKVNLTLTGIVRWALSVGYRQTARMMLSSPFKDTETGFKFFRRDAILPVLDRCADRHWFWDTEVMLEAHRAGLSIEEVPALFQRQPSAGSSLNVIGDTLGYLRAIRTYRRNRRHRDG